MINRQKRCYSPSGGINCSLYYFTGTKPGSSGEMITRKISRIEVMFRQLKKTLVATLIATLTLGQMMPAFTGFCRQSARYGNLQQEAPCTIGQEMQMGDYYVRQLRGSAPLHRQTVYSFSTSTDWACACRLACKLSKDPVSFLLQSIMTKSTPLLSLAATWCCIRRCFAMRITESQLASVMPRTKFPT